MPDRNGIERSIAATGRRWDTGPDKVSRIGKVLEQLSVVLVDMPQMLREILKYSLRGEISVVREISNADGLAEAAEETGATVFIGDMTSGIPGAAARVFDRFPRPVVVALDGSGRRGVVYTLRPHARTIGDISPRRVLSAIYSARHSTEPS